jgi:riboflavin kinase/FMN adenylyltransferase
MLFLHAQPPHVKVYSSLEQFSRLEKAVVTIGTFDGVHAGHQRIIWRMREIAAQEGAETVVLTFFPHPRTILQPDDDSLKLITTIEERERLLREAGIDHLIIQPFSREFSRITATEFVRDVLVRTIGTSTLVIGYDHRFGRNREGSYKDLEAMAPVYGFRLEEIPAALVNEMAVSSTKIRKALSEGDVAGAAELLGHPFSFTGNVVKGDRIGRSIGFPTANLQVEADYQLIPAEGIYAVKAGLDDRILKGMLYIGRRPVVQGKSRRIEVNLFDFDEQIYGRNLRIWFHARIREDRPLPDLEALRRQLEQDRVDATNLLA